MSRHLFTALAALKDKCLKLYFEDIDKDQLIRLEPCRSVV